MKIKEETINNRKVRLTKQSEKANYGAGVYLVRTLTLCKKNNKNVWKLLTKQSFYDEKEAENYYQKEILWIKRTD